MRRLWAVTAAIALGVVAVPVGGNADPSAAPAASEGGAPAVFEGVRRHAGDTRYATAAALSRAAFPSADTVLLATGERFPDALAASWLAAVHDAPVLLTSPDTLRAEVVRELRRLETRQVLLLGGPAALSTGIEDQLDDLGLGWRRISGADRAATAAALAREAAAAAGGARGVVLARSDDFADALAAASLAVGAEAPVLLTSATGLDPGTRHALDDLLDPGDPVWLAGGPVALSDAVEQAVVEDGYDARRLAGSDRYATAAMLAQHAVAEGAPVRELVLTSGAVFADALAAGPAAAAHGGLLLLVHPSDLHTSEQTRDLLTHHAGTDAIVAGGPVAVHDTVLEQVDRSLFGAPEVVLHGGTVVTMDADAPADAIALRGRRIVATGTADEMRPLAGASTQVVDLQGHTVVPGFVDAHTHIIGDREIAGVPDVDEVIEQLVGNGFTTVVEAYVHQPRVEELAALDAADRLPIRVEAFLPARAPDGTELEGGDGWWQGYRPYQQLSPNVRAAGIKLHLDFEDTNYTDAQATALAQPAHARGWTLALHGINHETTSQALRVLRGLLDGRANVDHHRVEHLLQLTDDLIQGFVDSGVVASVQVGGTTANLYNSDRNREAYVDGAEDQFARWRDLDEAGARMIGSTDAPWFLIPDAHPDGVVPQDVWQAFDLVHGTVTRTPMFGPPVPDFVTEQALSRSRALELMTVDPARALDRAFEIGRLRPGMFADLVMASADPTTVPVGQLDDIEVVAAIAQGRTVHCRDAAPACPSPSWRAPAAASPAATVRD